MSKIITGTTEFEGIEYLTREVPDLEIEGGYITVSEQRLNDRLWDNDKGNYREPEIQCRIKDENFNAYLPTQDLLTMTDEQVFNEFYS